MKTYQITEAQIKQAHEKPELMKEWFPEVFEMELKTGWIKQDRFPMWLVFFDLEKKTIYGFDTEGYWFNEEEVSERVVQYYKNNAIKPATHAEVETALVEEAVKRNYKPGTKIESLLGLGEVWIQDYGTTLLLNDFSLKIGGCVVFKDGKWATIISEPARELTKEQIE